MARSDKNILREYEEETDFCIYFILDTSASMGYGGVNPKIHYASEVIAALSFIAVQQKDQFALGVQNEDNSKILLRPRRKNPTVMLLSFIPKNPNLKPSMI